MTEYPEQVPDDTYSIINDLCNICPISDKCKKSKDIKKLCIDEWERSYEIYDDD